MTEERVRTSFDIKLYLSTIRGILELARGPGRKHREVPLNDEQIVTIWAFGMEALVDGEMLVLECKEEVAMHIREV